jgi:glycosyltransferase involved in cell wall biosynthesis
MRILVATSHRGIVGGVETGLRDGLRGLRNRGHEVALAFLYPAAPGQAGIDDKVGGLPAWQLGGARGDEALREVVAWRPDVAYLHGLDDPALEGALLARFPTVLFVHDYHGTCVSGNKRHGALPAAPCDRVLGPACLALYYPRRCGGLNPATLLRRYRAQQRHRALLPRYQAVVVASRHMAEEYRRHGVTDDRLRLLPLFPPGQAPDPEPPAPRPVRGRLLMVGRLTKLKGAQLLVPAVARASAALGRPLSLVVAGDGPERPALEVLAGAAGLRSEFVGWVDTPARVRLMRDADLLAVPSVWPEPFGVVGLEAGCVGLPAVAYRVGGIPDWLHPGESGELAPGDPPTVPGLADALVRALRDPGRLDRLRRGAWEVARTFTPTAHLDRLESILSEAVDRQSRSRHFRGPRGARLTGPAEVLSSPIHEQLGDPDR